MGVPRGWVSLLLLATAPILGRAAGPTTVPAPKSAAPAAPATRPAPAAQPAPAPNAPVAKPTTAPTAAATTTPSAAAPAAATTPARSGPRKVQILWDGVPEAESYELQLSKDGKFAGGTPTLKLASSKTVIDLTELPPHVRIRPIISGTAGEWYPLKVKKWPAPKLPAIIKVGPGENGEKEIQWPPVPLAEGEELDWRVRILTPRGSVVADELVPENSFKIPRLSPGDYHMILEPTGDPITGTIRWSAEGALAVRLQVIGR